MKKHHKVGNRPSRPGYRTPSDFKARKTHEVSKSKTISKNK